MLDVIKGEKKCEVCGTRFLNKKEPDALRCPACVGKSPELVGPNDNFVYQDVTRGEIEAKLNLALAKLDTILKLLNTEKGVPEYSKKCETCGQVFVSDKPATRYCDLCKAKK
jgi:Zn finger protein HypA/HybF involved in hydrogenase expression